MKEEHTITRARREAQQALQPTRQFLRSALWLALAAVALAAFLAVTGRASYLVLMPVVASTVALGVAGRYFERYPVSFAKWIGRIAYLSMVAWLVTSIIRWDVLWICVSLIFVSTASFSSHEAKMERQVSKYLSLGGRMDELFDPPTSRDQPTINPTGVVILMLLFAFGVAVIWPSPDTSGRIGIGGR